MRNAGSYKTEFTAQWALAKPTSTARSDRAINDAAAFARAVSVRRVPEDTTFDPKKYFDNRYADAALAKIRGGVTVGR